MGRSSKNKKRKQAALVDDNDVSSSSSSLSPSSAVTVVAVAADTDAVPVDTPPKQLPLSSTIINPNQNKDTNTKKNKKQNKKQKTTKSRSRSRSQQQQQRFWIENCKDSSSLSNNNNNNNSNGNLAATSSTKSLEVLITQCQLIDDYTQVSVAQQHQYQYHHHQCSPSFSSSNNVIESTTATATATDIGSKLHALFNTTTTTTTVSSKSKSKSELWESKSKLGEQPSSQLQLNKQLDGNTTKEKSSNTNTINNNAELKKETKNDGSDNDDNNENQQQELENKITTTSTLSTNTTNYEDGDDSGKNSSEVATAAASNKTTTTTTTNDNNNNNKQVVAMIRKEGDGKNQDDNNKNDKDIYSTAFICIKRTKSAKKPIDCTGFDVADSSKKFKPLPHGDCGDGICNPYDPKTQVPNKFWSQRKRLFTKYDLGIQLDYESWYSVTPEVIANHISTYLICNSTSTTTDNNDDHDNGDGNNDSNGGGDDGHQKIILDPFSGCGGNAISFGRIPNVKKVICVDTDISKLYKAAHNAKLYNIPSTKLVFIHNNACTVLSCYKNKLKIIQSVPKPQEQKEVQVLEGGYKLGGIELLPNKIDVIFLSPPWGGMDYGKVGKRNYTLKCIQIDAGISSVGGTTVGAATTSANASSTPCSIDDDFDNATTVTRKYITPTDNNINNDTTRCGSDGDRDDSSQTMMVDGDDVLKMAATALGCNGPIGLFLPKNINGISLGRSVLRAGYETPMVLEKNVLNGKLKTVTAYIGL